MSEPGWRTKIGKALAWRLRAMRRHVRRGARIVRWHLLTSATPAGAHSIDASRLIWRSGARLIATDRGPRLVEPAHGKPEPAMVKMILDLCQEAGISALLIPEPDSPSNQTIGIDRVDAKALLTAIAEVRQPWYASDQSGETDSPGEHLLGTDERTLAGLVRADAVSLTRYSSPGQARAPARADSAKVAFWTAETDRSFLLSTPTGHRTLRPPGIRNVVKVGVGGTITRSAPAWTAQMMRGLPDLDVDVVYLWVDGDDPVWRRRRAATMARMEDQSEQPPEGAFDASRFRSRDELRYSLRSVSTFAPWIRHIWLVTDQQVPPWLDRTVPGLTVVDHRDLFSEDELPVFNTRALETRLHTIPGLAEHYLYFNDDVLLGRRVERDLFFATPTVSKFFISKVTLTPRTSRAGASVQDGGRLLTQELISHRFGVTPLNLFRHTPYPQQRSLMYELEEMFREHFTRTASSPIRSGDDIIASTWLHHHAGYFLGRTVPGPIDYDYFSTGELATKPEVFERFAGNRCQTYCLNDADPGADDLSTDDLHRALDKLLPEPSPFER